MYTGEVTRGRIESFLIGYQLGSENHCDFTNELGIQLKRKYKVNGGSVGWVSQIDQIAKNRNKDWIAVFQRESLLILAEKLDDDFIKEFELSIRKGVISKLGTIGSHFGNDWLNDWSGTYELLPSEIESIWEGKELEYFMKLNEELSIVEQKIGNNKKVKPTEKLKKISSKLLKELKKSKNET